MQRGAVFIVLRGVAGQPLGPCVAGAQGAGKAPDVQKRERQAAAPGGIGRGSGVANQRDSVLDRRGYPAVRALKFRQRTRA